MATDEENKTLQELLRELEWLRAHNQECRGRGAPALPVAEAAIVLMTLERFLRILPGIHATDKETLPQLLQRAVAIQVLALPDPGGGAVIDRVRRIRNAV